MRGYTVRKSLVITKDMTGYTVRKSFVITGVVTAYTVRKSLVITGVVSAYTVRTEPHRAPWTVPKNENESKNISILNTLTF